MAKKLQIVELEQKMAPIALNSYTYGLPMNNWYPGGFSFANWGFAPAYHFNNDPLNAFGAPNSTYTVATMQENVFSTLARSGILSNPSVAATTSFIYGNLAQNPDPLGLFR